MSVTYNSLVTSIASTANIDNDIFAAAIPVAMYRAQEEIARAYTGNALNLALIDATFVAGEYIVDKPFGWLNTVSFSFGSGDSGNTINILKPRTYEFCSNYWTDRTATSTPKYYADYDDNHWLITPTPDDDYGIEVICKVMPVTLSEDQQTNWFTNKASGVLFYRTMLELAPYLRDDERIPAWQNFYTTGMAILNGSPG